MMKKLISLNMALLLAVLSAYPALAAEADGDWQAEYPDSIGRLAEKELGDGPSLLEDEEAYTITVNGTSFQSDTEAAGTNWVYDPDENILWLNGYSGGSIVAGGDLTIYSLGTVTVTGAGGTYGASGISVNGLLQLYVWNGILTVQGGSGTAKGGDGVASLGCICSCRGTARFFGGATTASASGDDVRSGGDGVYGRSLVMLLGSGITATGGDGNISGGCGVISSAVYVYNPVSSWGTQYAAVDCTIQGGNGGTYGGPGIYYGSECVLEEANMNILGGSGSYGYAIVYSETPNLSFSQHTTATGSAYVCYVRVKRYTLTLYGNGGYRGSDHSTSPTSLTGYYPSTYDLPEYQFQKDGCTQVGWSTVVSNGDLQSLNLLFTPTTPTSLYAIWEPTAAGDILLNVLEGTLSGGQRYQKYSGTQVTLPEQVTYGDTEESLLGWCTVLDATPGNLEVYQGQWYSGGDTVPPDSSGPVVLYAHPQSGGQYAVYHPTQGTVAEGGTIIVQGTAATQTSLTVYTPDDSAVTAPKGCVFAGWSDSANGSTADYAAGTALTLSPGTVRHLYAVWVREEYDYQPETGITITSIPRKDKVRLTVTSDWCAEKNASRLACAVYRDGKMIACAALECQTGQDTVLELNYTGDIPPVCKVFALDAEGRPAFGGVACDLPSLSADNQG